MIPWLLNSAWMVQSLPEVRRLRRAVSSVEATQVDVLMRIVRANMACEFGRRYRFDSVRQVADFRERVPISNDESLQEVIERIAAGENGVLTSEPVRLLEPTGGSSGAVKLVPYTASLQREFQAAINAWIGATFWSQPAVRAGRAYWSITPMAQVARRTTGGLRIGFQEDSEYLASWQRRLARRVLVAPAALAQLRNMDNARYATLCYLLASDDLTLVSIWSPLFLIALLDAALPWWESICADLSRGAVRLPYPAEDPGAQLPLDCDPRRGDQLAALARESASIEERWSACWPHLALISCWGDGTSSLYLPELQRRFPRVRIQPKGLLATEGVVTIPWGEGPGGLLAVRSHFFEFQPTDVESGSPGSNPPRLAHELSQGSRYRVLLTTGGGLYRYDLGDEVEVVGFEQECPRLRLLGRSTAVSDLVGEKLHEDHVCRALEETFQTNGIRPEWAVLIPLKQTTPYYVLYLASDCGLGLLGDARALAAALDSQLSENPQYRLARELRQLGPLQVQIFPASAAWLGREFERYQVGAGRRAGDLKPTVLDYRGLWREFLANPIRSS